MLIINRSPLDISGNTIIKDKTLTFIVDEDTIKISGEKTLFNLIFSEDIFPLEDIQGKTDIIIHKNAFPRRRDGDVYYVNISHTRQKNVFFVNKYAMQVETKDTTPIRGINATRIFSIVVPSVEMPLNELIYMLDIPLGVSIESNLQIEEVSDPNLTKIGFLPTVEIVGPSTMKTNDIQKFTVMSDFTKYKLHLYVKSYQGYIPNRKIVLENGEASFMFHSLGLESGTSVKLSVGYKYRTNIARTLVTIE